MVATDNFEDSPCGHKKKIYRYHKCRVEEIIIHELLE